MKASLLLAAAALAPAAVSATECSYCDYDDINGKHQTTEIVKQQVGRQIIRQISDSITDHIAASVNNGFRTGPASTAGLNRLGASSDSGIGMNSAWDNFSWTRLEEDGLATGVEVDMYQNSAGADLRFGNFIIGAALTYVNSDSMEGNFGARLDNRTNTVELTPYAAYIINDNMFVSATTSYGYYNIDPTGATLESEMEAYNSELALNGLHMIDKLSLRGKAGFRYQHWHTKNVNNTLGLRDSIDNWGFLADAEIGYNVLDNLRTYTGAYFEYNDRVQPNQANLIITPATSQRPSGFGYGESVFYFNAGIDYYINKSLSVGAKYQTDLSDNVVDLHTVGLNVRLAM
ncbi:MAG: hypothetical protein Kow0065_18510 [Methylomicrobium sp.]